MPAGYITRHYGRPADDVHVLQIEIARALYMDEARIERLPDFRLCSSRSPIWSRLDAAGP